MTIRHLYSAPTFPGWVFILSLVACAVPYTPVLETKVPTVFVKEKVPVHMALVITEQERDREYSFSYGESLNRMNLTAVPLGKNLETVLVLSLSRVFERLSVVRTQPKRHAYQGFIIPKITQAEWNEKTKKFVLAGTLRVLDDSGREVASFKAESQEGFFPSHAVSQAVSQIALKWVEAIAMSKEVAEYASRFNSALPVRGTAASMLPSQSTFESFQPPVILVTSPSPGAVTEQEQMELMGGVVNMGGSVVKNIEVFLNGQAIGTSVDSPKINIAPGGQQRVSLRLMLQLQLGENRVELVAKNDRELTAREIVIIRREQASPAAAVELLPPIKVKARDDDYAVVIGIEKYRDVKSAEYASRDANLIKKYLTQLMGFPEQNVASLLNDRATRSDIEKYLGDWLKARVSKESRVFIYFAGHGSADPKGDGFLLPYEGDPSNIRSTGYALNSLKASLDQLPAKEIIVALDSCFSGAGGRSVIAKGSRPIMLVQDTSSFAKPGRVFFTAATGAQISTVHNEAQYGLFTYFFLKGLKGDADLNKDGTVDTDELYKYVRAEVEKAARQQNIEQTPTVSSPLAGGLAGIVLTRLK